MSPMRSTWEGAEGENQRVFAAIQASGIGSMNSQAKQVPLGACQKTPAILGSRNLADTS
jgi:hypothetical protein